MTKDDLIKLETESMDLLVKRRNIGSASYEASEIMHLLKSNYEILRHLREQTERKK